MRLLISLLCTASVLGCSVLSFAGSAEKRELTATDLLAEYEKLAPINESLKEGRWDMLQHGDYPKILGTFNSLQVGEVFWCGDVCPQYGSVNIVFSNIGKGDCPSIGQSLYSHFWGTQYQGCTPLIGRDGQLVENGLAGWSINYYPDEGSAKPVITEGLRFDDSSMCYKRAEKVPCYGFKEGQRVFAKGTKSGNDLAVLKLDLQ